MTARIITTAVVGKENGSVYVVSLFCDDQAITDVRRATMVEMARAGMTLAMTMATITTITTMTTTRATTATTSISHLLEVAMSVAEMVVVVVAAAAAVAEE